MLTYKVVNAPHQSVFLDQLKYRINTSINIEIDLQTMINLPCPTVARNLKIVYLDSFRWISTGEKNIFRISGMVIDEYHFPDGRYFVADIDCVTFTGEVRVETS